jgi:3-dehydroquinate synthase
MLLTELGKGKEVHEMENILILEAVEKLKVFQSHRLIAN